MNDALKWVLIALISAIAVFAGGEALGINWSALQVSMLSFLQTVGWILLVFTGSAAAIEVAKYYRHKNRLVEEEKSSSAARHVGEGELQRMLKEAVVEALEMHQARTEEPSLEEPGRKNSALGAGLEKAETDGSTPARRRRKEK